MLQAFKQFFSNLAASDAPQAQFKVNDDRLAAAALLIHAAVIDGTISDAERERLTDVLMQRFDLGQEEAVELVRAATEAEQQAVDLYRFTSLLNRCLDDKGRQQVIAMMWQVVHADGRVTEFEDNLVWRAADLLHVPSEARIALRQQVAAAQGPRHD